MIHTDRNALLCDLAEMYHIYDFRALPASRVALFSAGLGDNSRIKMKMSGRKVSNETLLLATAVDLLNVLVWRQTKDGQKGRNMPDSIVERILHGPKEKTYKTDGFATPEAFWQARQAILERR